ncbi:uncharacterized protein [Euwallacea similis]|uniref:uncharacterized protein n=1 Tax=Euwallacea similis TaxID=1736056 RepID=UPI0034509EAA
MIKFSDCIGGSTDVILPECSIFMSKGNKNLRYDIPAKNQSELLSNTEFKNDAYTVESSNTNSKTINTDSVRELIPMVDSITSLRTQNSTYSSGDIPLTIPRPPFFNASSNDFFSDKGGKFLGAVAFGSVFLAVGLFDKPVAVKKISLDPVDSDHIVKQFKNEVEVLYKYKHENLVTLLGYSCDTNTYCLVYEYVPGGFLYEALQRK